MVVVEMEGFGTVVVVVDTERLTMTAADGQGELAALDESAKLTAFVVVDAADVLSELDGITISHVAEYVGQAGCFAEELERVIVTVTVSVVVDAEQAGLESVVEFSTLAVHVGGTVIVPVDGLMGLANVWVLL